MESGETLVQPTTSGILPGLLTMERRLQLTWAALAVSFILVMAGLVGTFYLTPLEVKQIGFTQKIFYFHVPMAATSGTAFFITLAASLAFLITGNKKWDTWAVVGAELGILFGAMLLTMGILWQRSTWGVWWTWDPRLTSFLVVMILYAGYFVLRSSVENEEQRARYAAALGVFAYPAVIFTMLSTRILRSIHPVLFTLKGTGLESPMLWTFMLAMFGTLAVMSALLMLRVTMDNVQEEIDGLKDRIGVD